MFPCYFVGFTLEIVENFPFSIEIRKNDWRWVKLREVIVWLQNKLQTIEGVDVTSKKEEIISKNKCKNIASFHII